MVTTDDAFAALQTEIVKPFIIPMNACSGGELVQPAQRLTGLRGGA